VLSADRSYSLYSRLYINIIPTADAVAAAAAAAVSCYNHIDHFMAPPPPVSAVPNTRVLCYSSTRVTRVKNWALVIHL